MALSLGSSAATPGVRFYIPINGGGDDLPYAATPNATLSVLKEVTPAGQIIYTLTGIFSATGAQTVTLGDKTGRYTATITSTAATAPSLSGTAGSATVGAAYSFQPALTGGAGGGTWRIASGSLPDGLSMNPRTGLISGTPSSGSTTGSATITYADIGGMATALPVAVTVTGGATFGPSTTSVTASVPTQVPIAGLLAGETVSSVVGGQMGANGTSVVVLTSSSQSVTVTTSAGRTITFTVSGGGGPVTPSIDQQRIDTLAKIMRVATAAQTNNPQDVAPLGITPTVSLSSSLPVTANYTTNPELFEVWGGAPIQCNDANLWLVVDAEDAPNTGGGLQTLTPSGRYWWSYQATFNIKVTNTRYVEIWTNQSALTGLRLWINGALAQAGRAAFNPNAGSGYQYVKYDLGSVGTYELGSELSGGIQFGGIRADAGATFSKPTRADTPTYLFLGDSYTSGVSTTTVRGDALMPITGRLLGGKNVTNAGLSGSVIGPDTSTAIKRAPQFYADFVKPILGPVLDPDMIVIAWGYNDTTNTVTTVAAIQAMWTQVRADYPRALIVCMGMWGAPLQLIATLQNREEAIRAQFNTWADPFSVFVRVSYANSGALGRDQRFMFGLGYAGSPSYDGINDYIVRSDKNHLTDGYDQRNGQWYVATRIRDALIGGINRLPTTYNPSNTKVPAWPLNIKGALATPPAATVGSPYLFATMATGGKLEDLTIPAKTFTILTGTIPPGLALQASAGHLTGTPTTAGTYNFTIRVTDQAGTTADLPVTIVVS